MEPVNPTAGPANSRRDWMKGVAAAAATIRHARGALAERPNILYLHSHDTGRYLQPYGHDVPAPSIQKLASEGVMFRQAFDAAPTCSPSRASLLTGHCPHNNGMLGLAHRGFALADYKQHIAHALRPHGYESTLIGIQHLAMDPAVIGYDRVLASPSFYKVPQTTGARREDIVAAAVSYLSRRPKQPFFLDVGFFETHRAFPAPGPREDVRFCRPPGQVPDTPATRKDMAAFKASARLLDEAYGQILTALERSTLAPNTLVICTTDHGIPFPGMKCNLTAQGTGVSLILRGPGFVGGKVCDAMVSQMDLYPTVCDMLGIEKPAWLQGKSLLPVIRGHSDEIHDELFAEVNYHAAYEPKRSVRTQRFNYIRNYGNHAGPVLPNCDDSPSKTVWLENGWREHPVPREMLFDTVFDPAETLNLALDPAYGRTLAQMRNRLDSWMERTSDPLLNGFVPAPAGAVANDPDGISPSEPTHPVSQAAG